MRRAGPRPSPVAYLLPAKGAHLDALDRPRCDRPDRLPSFAVITGVAGVLAAGVIRDDLQAHLALARVGEQPPSSTPTSLPVRTIGSSERAGSDEMTARPGQATAR